MNATVTTPRSVEPDTMPMSEHTRIGHASRELRVRKGLSIREVAQRANVNKATVLRLEQGKTIRPESFERICAALGTAARRMVLPEPESMGGAAIHRREHGRWMATGDTRPTRSVLAGLDALQDERERMRLGSLGFVTGFGRLFNCALPDGYLVAGELEVYKRDDSSGVARGELFVLCTRGTLRVVVGEASFLLHVGDALTVVNDGDFYSEPETPVGPGQLPPTLLYVRLNYTRPTVGRAPTSR